MSPTKRTKAKRAAPRAPRAPKSAAPAPWNADIRDINVVWYNVTDFARAKKFYGETLGLPVVAQIDGVGWIEYGRPNQTHLALNEWRGPAPMPPTNGGATATFACDDVRGAIARLRAKGVRCDEVEEIPGMVILGSFYDPEGNRLQLAESPQPVA
jgi:predicted enzyme related to lactoylglutathione lyase